MLSTHRTAARGSQLNFYFHAVRCAMQMVVLIEWFYPRAPAKFSDPNK
jgi:hypothetical protein